MATQQQVTGLFKQLGARIADAHNAAKDVPVDTGGGVGLPAGINDGVAQLTVMEFIEGKKDEDKGKFYFRAAGVVVNPQFHDGKKIGGKQTSVLIPFFDTPKRANKKSFVNDHWPSYRDLFAKMGVEQPPAQQPGESKDAASERINNYYQAATQALLAQRPHFEFRTWKGEKATTGQYAGQEPRVSEFWGQRCEWRPTADPTTAVQPSAAPSSPAAMNGTAHAPAVPPPIAPAPLAPATAPQAAPAATSLNVPDDATLAALAETADSDPERATDEAVEACGKLSAACRAVGITNEEAEAQKDWTAVAALISQRRGGSAAPVAPAPSPTAASAQPLDESRIAKGAQVSYRGALCTVTSASTDTKTATLKGPDGKSILGADKKLVKVPFAELS